MFSLRSMQQSVHRAHITMLVSTPLICWQSSAPHHLVGFAGFAGPLGQDQLKCKHLAPAPAAAAAAISKAPAAAATAAAAAKQQQQQQKEESAPAPGHMLHTPMRVRVKDNSSTIAAIAPADSRAGNKIAAYDGCNARAGAVTPPRQQTKAIAGSTQGATQASAYGDSPIRVGRPVTPLRGTAGAGQLHSSNAAAAAAAVGLLSPRLAAMGGSARRVVSTQARTAGTAAAAAGGSGAVMHTRSSGTPPDNGTLAGAPAEAVTGPPPTPLQKPAKRTVDDRQVDEGDKQLEALVERCLRITTPGEACKESTLCRCQPHPHQRGQVQPTSAALVAVTARIPALASKAACCHSTAKQGNSSSCH